MSTLVITGIGHGGAELPELFELEFSGVPPLDPLPELPPLDSLPELELAHSCQLTVAKASVPEGNRVALLVALPLPDNGVEKVMVIITSWPDVRVPMVQMPVVLSQEVPGLTVALKNVRTQLSLTKTLLQSIGPMFFTFTVHVTFSPEHTVWSVSFVIVFVQATQLTFTVACLVGNGETISTIFVVEPSGPVAGV